ncbi:c-type cytochrome [Leptothrix sp. BB-4]
MSLVRGCTALALAGAPAFVSAAAPEPSQDGARAFHSACGPCHSSNAGHRIGPALLGVVGRLSGTAPGYDYSEAMKQAAVRWDEDTLGRFLLAPVSLVPGTRMSFPGLKDEARRRAIVDYLAGLRAE